MEEVSIEITISNLKMPSPLGPSNRILSKPCIISSVKSFVQSTIPRIWISRGISGF